MGPTGLTITELLGTIGRLRLEHAAAEPWTGAYLVLDEDTYRALCDHVSPAERRLPVERYLGLRVVAIKTDGARVMQIVPHPWELLPNWDRWWRPPSS